MFLGWYVQPQSRLQRDESWFSQASHRKVGIGLSRSPRLDSAIAISVARR